MAKSNSAELAILLAAIDRAFDHKSWHGINLKGAIRGLTAEDASWRPAQGRHNIWELVVHAAYWKYVVIRRLLSEKRGSFPITGSNWFVRPSNDASSEGAWRADVRLLTDMHKTLKQAVEGVSAKDLNRIPPGVKTSNLDLIGGIAAHDLYHAGQIQLLKRLRPQA